MTFAVTTTAAAIQTKYMNKILSLREIIEKFLLLKKFFSTTLPHNLDATLKVYLVGNFLSKTTTKRWNQANLGYFDPHFDKVYGES